MKFPIDLSAYQPLRFSVAQQGLDPEQRATLLHNIRLVRDSIVFFTALANTKGLGGHTGGAYDIVPELLIADGFMKGSDSCYPVYFDEAGHRVEFIVLARYMQILSDQFVVHYQNRIINIHHSFLPAFPGARPYHSAFERGVKVIGATSHYVTADLDAGPIIAQDIIRVSHADSVEDLVRKGRDMEKVILSRSIWHHLQRQILVYQNRTVVFA